MFEEYAYIYALCYHDKNDWFTIEKINYDQANYKLQLFDFSAEYFAIDFDVDGYLTSKLTLEQKEFVGLYR